MSTRTVDQKAARRVQSITGCLYTYALNLCRTPSVRVRANQLKDELGVSLQDAIVRAALEKVDP